LQVWYDYARWQADSGGGVAQAAACLQRAVHALPNCLLLFFALADLHEAQGDVAAAKQVGKRVQTSTLVRDSHPQHCYQRAS
jgi:Tfp pilus assembly protein PilF